MELQSKPFILISIMVIIFNSCLSNKRSQEIPEDFKKYITQTSTSVEYKEIIPFHGGVKINIPSFITREQALEDIQMFEYLLRTSYSGFEYWKYKGVDFNSYFADLRDFVNKNDTLFIAEFEEALSKILTQIDDGHISLIGTSRNTAYRHKSVYYCDILVGETEPGIFKVLDSRFDMVKVGDLFTQNDREKYLFKTLSPKGKNLYLIGRLSLDVVTSEKLSFNDKIIQVPFFRSRLTFAKFNDPEPCYIKRENNIPIVRINSFANELYPAMKKFMDSGKELKEENKLVVNIMFNKGGSSLFPQTFIQNLNGVMQWETHWAILKSPPIIEYFAKYDLTSMPDISPDFKNLILSNREELADYHHSPAKNWEFTSTHNENIPGSYAGTLIILTNRNVLSAGEAFVGVSQSIKNRIVIGENTGGSAQFPSACGYYLPNSRFIANLPRHFILAPGLEECIGYLPDYWLNTTEPIKEVIDWLNDPENYRFSYLNSYHDMLKKLDISAVLPEDVNIIAPGSEVHETLAKFSGKWYGVSNGVLDHLLVVEKINHSQDVDAIYAWGVASQWGLRPGWQRFKGRFENHKLILMDEKSRIKITYKFSSDDYLDAIYERPGVYDYIELTKLYN